jgi:hypothetical protein
MVAIGQGTQLGAGKTIAEAHPLEQAFQALGWRESRLSGKVDRVRAAAGKLPELHGWLKAECFQASREALEGRRLVPVFDPTKRRRRDAGPNCKLALRNAGTEASIAKESA